MVRHKKLIFVNTKTFAAMLNINESELIYLYMTNGYLNGRPLPEMLYNRTNRTRQFRMQDVMAFLAKEEI